MLRAFGDAVAAGREPESSVADNLHSLAAVLACVESIERGEVVDVAAGSGARAPRAYGMMRRLVTWVASRQRCPAGALPRGEDDVEVSA